MFTKLILILTFVFCAKASAAELMQVPAAIHISSTVSEGKYSIDEIARVVKDKGFKVAVITDYYLSAFSYGVRPLQNIIRKNVEFDSVRRYGINKYLNDIDKAQKKNPGMVFLPAVEAAPFYYWEGNVLENNLKLKDWHKHFLVIGLDQEKDYLQLPVLGNEQALRMSFCFKDIVTFWPLMLIILGFLYCRKSRFYAYYSRVYFIVGIFILLAGAIFLVNNFPFCSYKFNQYQGSLGIKPYQNFIDYVKGRNGLTFWAHPEAQYLERQDKLKVETRGYISELVQAQGYDGYAIFYEGYKEIGCPGCLWDEILMQYCRGIRNSAAWAIGGLSFDDLGSLENALQDLRTVLLVAELNKEQALNALRQGHMYVIRGAASSQFILDEFSVKDSSRQVPAIMGETLKLDKDAEIRIRGHFLSGQQNKAKIKIIRAGKTIKSLEADTPFDLFFKDETAIPERKYYYRLEIESKDVLLVANPIFVERQVLK